MAAIRIFLNGELREVPSEISLDRLLESFSLPSGRIAIELNKQIIPKKNWDRVNVSESDRIEIVHFVGGG